MQDTNGKAQNNAEALEALRRILDGESDDNFVNDLALVSEALREEYEERENKTNVKAPHVRGLQAAKEFEEFVQSYLEEVKFFNKTYDKLNDEISYDVILPRIMLENLFQDGIVQKFVRILKEATGIDIGIERERKEFHGCIYLDVGFPAILRA